MADKKMLNRQDRARIIARETGLKISDVENILNLDGEVISTAISQGYSIKDHKLFKLDVKKKSAKHAYNGLKQVYFDQPEKYIVSFVQLTTMKEAIETYNNSLKEND